jgi:copper transport protein
MAVEVRRLGRWAILTVEARALLLAVAVAAATAISGHSASATGLNLLETAIRTIHLAAMGAWAGGVLALLLALLVLRRSGDPSPASALQLVVGFGPYAGVGLALLAVTGLLLSGEQVASITALLSTPYGAILVAKVAGVGLVACIALRHALLSWRGLRLQPAAARAPRSLLLTVGLEAGGALALVLLAAVLGSSAPARGPQFEPPGAAPVPVLVTEERDSLLASVSMKPNRAGPNLLSVHVVDTRRPIPAPIESVTVILTRPGSRSGPEQLPTTRSGSRFDAGNVTMVTGDVRVSVVINRAALGSTVIDVPWRVNPPEVARAPVVISSEPLAPLVNLAALVLALIAAVAFALGFRRSRATPAAPTPPGEPQPRSRWKGGLSRSGDSS